MEVAEAGLDLAVAGFAVNAVIEMLRASLHNKFHELLVVNFYCLHIPPPFPHLQSGSCIMDAPP